MRRDDVLLEDLVCACRDIQAFIEGMDAGQFYADIKTQAAVQQRFMVLGEATKRLSAEFRDAHPEVQWKGVAGMRDRLIHAYEAVDLSIVWRAASEQLPLFMKALEPVLPPNES